MLFKKMLRDMKEHKMQFIAIFLMSFLTLLVFAGVGAEVAGVQQSVDSFYEDTNMADVWLYPNEINNQTIQKIMDIDTTDDMERQLVLPTTADIVDDPSVDLHFVENNTIAKYYPMDGNEFDINDEKGIWLDKRFAEANNLKVGDNIKLKFNGTSIEKTIRGLGYSPEYVYSQGDSLLPDFKMHGFGYLSYKAFIVDDVPYNTILIKTDDMDYQSKLDEKINYSTYLPFDDHTSVNQFQQELDQHNMIGNLLPIIFVAVALLTLLTTMTRIVNNQRTQIGTLKALGFSDRTLTLHYVSYGFYLTVVGCVLGLIIGELTIPSLFFPSMSAFYTLPSWKGGFDIKFVYISLIMIVLSTFFTYLATKNISKESPASTLMPKAPKFSGQGLFEKSKLWNKMGFNGRWNYRDIKRNKVRSLVTIVSIIGCTLLLITAFGMDEGMDDLKSWQYGGINHYDNQVILEDNVTSAQIDDITKKYDGTQFMNQQIEIKANGISQTSSLLSYNKSDLITPTDKNMNPIDLPEDGVSLTEKTSEILGVKKGDTIEWHLYGDDNWTSSKIDEIYADPATQGITIRPNKLEELGYNFTPNMILTNRDINSRVDGVSSVNNFGDLQNTWDNLTESANIMIGVLLLFATVLSIVMLYSLGVLAFTEAERDLATLKVVGFKTRNIRRLFLSQNLILSVIGFIIGIPIGYYVLRLLMDYSGSSFYYPIHYSIRVILIVFVIVIGLSIFVNLLFSRKIRDIDMVESLKKARD